MSHAYSIPVANEPAPVAADEVVLVASGDLRHSANRMGWPAQQKLEADIAAALSELGIKVRRAHGYDPEVGHGFIWNQRMGMDVFATIHPDAPVIVAEAVWEYSHHVLAGLKGQRGPILTAANWSGQWPGLVGLLNLNASMTKAGMAYSSIWSEDFTRRLRPPRPQGVGSHQDHHARHLARAWPGRGLPAGRRGRAGACPGRPPAAHQGRHGRLRRRLHGHVQRHLR